MKTLRVLVVDDSAVNRRTIADMLTAIPNVEVVAKASDGDEALRLAMSLKPDLITLDLEMPRMDGFTFMRLLMVSRPTPVIVISGYAAKENVFRALELGAIDPAAEYNKDTLLDNLLGMALIDLGKFVDFDLVTADSFKPATTITIADLESLELITAGALAGTTVSLTDLRIAFRIDILSSPWRFPFPTASLLVCCQISQIHCFRKV